MCRNLEALNRSLDGFGHNERDRRWLDFRTPLGWSFFRDHTNNIFRITSVGEEDEDKLVWEFEYYESGRNRLTFDLESWRESPYWGWYEAQQMDRLLSTERCFLSRLHATPGQTKER